MAARSAKALTGDEIETLRQQLAGGKRPRVQLSGPQFDADATGTITKIGDPAVDGSDYITVRVKVNGISDELAFAPAELSIRRAGSAGRAGSTGRAGSAGRGSTRRVAKSTKTNKPGDEPAPTRTTKSNDKAGDEARPTRPAALTTADVPQSQATSSLAAGAVAVEAAGSQIAGIEGVGSQSAGSQSAGSESVRSQGAGSRAAGPPSARSRTARSTTAPAAGRATAAKPAAGRPTAGTPTKAPAAASVPAPQLVSGRRRKQPAPPKVSFTVSSTGASWAVSATRGAKGIAKNAAIPPGAVTAIADLLDQPALVEAVAEINETAWAEAQSRADQLRAELHELEAVLAAHRNPS